MIKPSWTIFPHFLLSWCYPKFNSSTLMSNSIQPCRATHHLKVKCYNFNYLGFTGFLLELSTLCLVQNFIPDQVFLKVSRSLFLVPFLFLLVLALFFMAVLELSIISILTWTPCALSHWAGHDSLLLKSLLFYLKMIWYLVKDCWLLLV